MITRNSNSKDGIAENIIYYLEHRNFSIRDLRDIQDIVFNRMVDYGRKHPDNRYRKVE